MIKKKYTVGQITFKTVAYILCILLLAMSTIPFIIMIVNATRSTPEIQGASLSFIPSRFFMTNWGVIRDNPTFQPMVALVNSSIISVSATFLTIYFSTLTAFAVVAYNWKLRRPFFSFILAVMMIPAQVTAIGYFKFMAQLGMTNNLLALILPAIAAPMAVFFLRQYMVGALPLELLEASRIDGSGEFRTFNQIVLPIMKPAMATQAIFTFVASWNQLFLPQILLTDSSRFTMPLMISLLRGDQYRVELGAVYLGIALTVLPLFIIYFALSKYIIAGIALGSVKG